MSVWAVSHSINIDFLIFDLTSSFSHIFIFYFRFRYNNLNTGQSVCQMCPSGKVLTSNLAEAHDNVNDCQNCEPGKTSDATQAACVVCGAGTYTSEDNQTPW
jgi:hypothetical protein